ncbi:MAG: hypothetical protein H0U59_13110 [Gemmatimonadaceae bacterium]|nr:hypothetical protein [Gemmatimonadaceae bacterium]
MVQERLLKTDPLRRSLVRMLNHRDFARDSFGAYYFPEAALLRLEDSLKKHGVTARAAEREPCAALGRRPGDAMARTIYFTIAPRYGYDDDGCIERASYTKQDSGPEGTGLGLSPTRVAWRVLGDGRDGAWRVSCRTPDALLLDVHRRPHVHGFVIGAMGSDGAMIAWLDADPMLRRTP